MKKEVLPAFTPKDPITFGVAAIVLLLIFGTDGQVRLTKQTRLKALVQARHTRYAPEYYAPENLGSTLSVTGDTYINGKLFLNGKELTPCK